MSETIKVGDIVIFTFQSHVTRNSLKAPSIVSRVWGGGCVYLWTFPDDEFCQTFETSVPFKEEHMTEGFYWEHKEPD